GPPRPGGDQGQRERHDRRAQADRRPDVGVDAADVALPGQGRDPDGDGDGDGPLCQENEREEAVGPEGNSPFLGPEQLARPLLDAPADRAPAHGRSFGWAIPRADFRGQPKVADTPRRARSPPRTASSARPPSDASSPPREAFSPPVKRPRPPSSKRTV